MSAANNQRQTGAFISANHALPPVQIDASAWPREGGLRTAGDLVSANHALPGVKVNMIVPEQVFLELTLTLAAKALPEIAALRIAALVDRLDALDKALGGSGITWDKDRSTAHNGDLTVVGSTHDFAGAKERFKRLADDMKETVAAYFGPAGVLVKVYRVTPAGQREDAFEIKYPDVA